MFSVYQHWDPLKVCIVGRSWPPEFYAWITVPHVRELFERIAIETEEDYQKIISTLQGFGVEVLRPELPSETFVEGKFVYPPMVPRDHTVMIGQTFYNHLPMYDFGHFWYNFKRPEWPWLHSPEQLQDLPCNIKNTAISAHESYQKQQVLGSCYDHIIQRIKRQGNQIKTFVNPQINGAMVSRLGRDLYFGTMDYDQNQDTWQKFLDQEFPNTRNHVVNSGGHSDGTYCAVCPGLIISLKDIPTYKDTFPGWEVVYLPKQSWDRVGPFLHLKKSTRGKWWIPGFEYDQAVVSVVQTWLDHWTGYVEETVFDVNMLIIDPKNVLVFNHNDKVFDAFARYGLTAHVVTFRHRYFWDGGIHCITSDLNRSGEQQDYFPNRG